MNFSSLRFCLERFKMVYYESTYLCHYGLKGMKWGTRRWQFQDGRFNDAGKARYFGQNSSHRPDSVRKLQGDPTKSNRSSASNSDGGRSFDKEKAKKIAKGVAIGTAVVGGTVLAVYGAKKVHDLGGVSKIAQNAVAKHREVKIENLKATNDYKLQRLKVSNEYKVNRLQAKNEYKRARSKEIRDSRLKALEDLRDTKLAYRTNKLDPEGKFDKNVIKDLAEKMDQKGIKEKLKQLDADEVSALNSGKVKLSDLQGRNKRWIGIPENNPRSMMDASRNSPEFNKEYDKWLDDFRRGKADRMDRPIPDSSYFNKSSNPTVSNQTVKANVKLPKVKSPAQIVSEYKKAHPGTKLSNSQIVKNYSANTDKSSNSLKSASKTPRLTLTPETFTAGTKFLSEFNKTVQTFKSTNKEQEEKAKRGQKAVDEYTNSLLKR